MKRDIALQYRNYKREIDQRDVFPFLAQPNSVIHFIQLFEKINDIEVQLDGLINTVEKPEDGKLILEKIKLAKELSASLEKCVKARRKSISSPWIRFVDKLINEELINMIVAINEISFQVKEKLYAIKNYQSPKYFSLEQLMLPSIESYVGIISAELRNTLSQEGSNENQIDEFLKRNASILSEEFFSAEKDSILKKKYHGLSEHYLQILKTNENLTNLCMQIKQEKTDYLAEKAYLQSENQDLQNGIHLREIESEEIKAQLANLEVIRQQTEQRIYSLSIENQHLQHQVHELSYKFSMLNASSHADQNRDAKHHALSLSRFRK